MSDFGNGPPEKRRARTYFYALVGALSVVLVVVVPPPAKGAVIGLLITLVGGASGDTGRRFVVPLGVALFSYWITATARPYANFFETSAQVVPVLILAAVVEQRGALRDAVSGQGALLLFAATLSYMLLAEVSSLYAVATCAPDTRCAVTGVSLGKGVSFGA